MSSSLYIMQAAYYQYIILQYATFVDEIKMWPGHISFFDIGFLNSGAYTIYGGGHVSRVLVDYLELETVRESNKNLQ